LIVVGNVGLTVQPLISKGYREENDLPDTLLTTIKCGNKRKDIFPFFCGKQNGAINAE
jgi:hypothetical protein